MATQTVTDLDQAWLVIGQARAQAAAVSALKISRAPIPDSLRTQIGERDHWKCHVCREPVDPSIPYLLTPPTIRKLLDAELRAFSPHQADQVAAWVGQDTDRAYAANRWIYAQTIPADSTALKELHRHIQPLIEARRTHNRKTATIEHLRPVSVGGGNDLDNLAIAHGGCNLSTGYRVGTTAPRAANEHLLAARRHAQWLEQQVDLLRDGRQINPECLLDRFETLTELAEQLGLKDRAADAVYRALPAALKTALAGSQAHATSAHEPRIRTRACAARPVPARQLENELTRIDQRLRELSRPSAIRWWQSQRDKIAIKLERIDPNQQAR